MSYNLVTYKTIGAIYKINDVEYTKNNYKKRWIFLEIPSSTGGKQKSVIRKFLALGDDSDSWDWYEEGQWVQLAFRLDGKMWVKPETGDEILLQSEIIVDVHKTDNPFESQERSNLKIDDLTPDVVNQLAKDVKDWQNETGKKDVLFDDEDDNNDMPF